RQQNEYADNRVDCSHARRREPRANPISLIQVYESHKAPQSAKSFPKNQVGGCVFKKEAPIRTEVAGDVPDKTGENIQHGVTVQSGKNGINDESRTSAPGHEWHFYRQAPDISFDPRGKIKRGCLFKIGNPQK